MSNTDAMQISVRWDGAVQARTIREAMKLLQDRLGHIESGLKLTFTLPTGQQVKIRLPVTLIEVPMENSLSQHPSRVKFPQEGRIL